MSRVAKKPVTLPQGVTTTVAVALLMVSVIVVAAMLL